MSNTSTWIIVANSTEARIFKVVKFPKIEEVDALVHPEGHLYNRDLTSSRPGRTFQSTNTTRSAYEPKTTPKHLEEEKFSRTLAEKLAHAYQNGEFRRLYLFAEPSFLGLLRQDLDEHTKNAIVAESHKDLTKQKASDIEKNLLEITA